MPLIDPEPQRVVLRAWRPSPAARDAAGGVRTARVVWSVCGATGETPLPDCAWRLGRRAYGPCPDRSV